MPKHLDSPQISMTTVNNSDDEIMVRRGLEEQSSEINLPQGTLRSDDDVLCHSGDMLALPPSAVKLNKPKNNFMLNLSLPTGH